METKQLHHVESCSHLNPKASSPSPSSASSASDDDDFIQLDPIELEKSISGQNTPHSLGVDGLVLEQLRRPSKSSTDGDDIGRLSTVDLPISVAAGNPFMAADSPYAVTSSPPVQVMVKSDVPDPYRIPSSVFARTTTPVAPMDWSVASNESLFSIQGGNCSFSRDHVLLMGGKAGEDMAFPGPYDPFPPPPMSAPKILLEKEAAGGYSGGVAIKKTLSKSDYGDSDLGIQESSSPALKSSSAARRSDGSGASVHSFVFPILSGEGEKSGPIKAVENSQPTQQESMRLHEKPLKPTARTSGHSSSCSNCFPCICCCANCC